MCDAMTIRMDKLRQLRELARRRTTHVPQGYDGIGCYHDGVYECEHVSPYTKAAGNVDSQVMLILQDWCSSEFLKQPIREHVSQLGYDPCLPTNKNLIALLREHLDCRLSQVYVTNLFPFIKPGAMSNRIPVAVLTQAATDYGLPQMRIVSPTLVIAFGAATFNALRRAVGMKPAKNLSSAIASPFGLHGATVWCQSHPGALGRANRGVIRVHEDWRLMCNVLLGSIPVDRTTAA